MQNLLLLLRHCIQAQLKVFRNYALGYAIKSPAHKSKECILVRKIGGPSNHKKFSSSPPPPLLLPL